MSDTPVWLMRSFGLSHEDADVILTRISAEVMAWVEQQPKDTPEPTRLQPIQITFTADIDLDAITAHVVRAIGTAMTEDLQRVRVEAMQ